MIAGKFKEAIGIDVNQWQVDDCRNRFKEIHNLKFYHTDESKSSDFSGQFQIVICMETLEHCPEPIVDLVLDELNRLASDNGKIFISVPIEIGLTFIFKYWLRKMAGWRNLSDYKYYEKYSFRNAWKMIFANSKTQLDRPIYGGGHTHYGFNWLRLKLKIKEKLIVESVDYSPLGWLRGICSSQVWFTCRPKRKD